MKSFYTFIGSLFICLLSCSVYAQSIFLKVDDFTQNLGLNSQFVDYTELTSVQYGLQAEVSLLASPGPLAGKPKFGEIIITKNIDGLSNYIMNAMVRGIDFENMEIVATRGDGNGGLATMHKVELKNVYVTDFQTSSVEGCEGNCPSIAESVKFVYEAIRITTYKLNRNGNAVADDFKFEYNVRLGKYQF
jgi:type VI secretion system Hcp family effector